MDTLQTLVPQASLAPSDAALMQLPLLDGDGASQSRHHAVIASLALGGAERIVLDWAARSTSRGAVRLAVLRDADSEWPLPPNVELVRFHGVDVANRLREFGTQASDRHAAMVCCHLLTAAERRALREGGALTVPVLHNAASGWLEPASALADDHRVIAVSQAAARDYREAGGRVPCIVVRHFPHVAAPLHDARAQWRKRWAIPANARVIGMIGGVKPQKAYTRALRILANLLDGGDAPGGLYLVIVGGPAGRDGVLAWNALLAQALRLGVAGRLRLPGFISGGSQCLPAFDVFLNTSRYEGLSIATLEALAAELPVVASRVGGQEEIAAPGLSLLAFDAADEIWAAAIAACSQTRPPPPFWLGFPGERPWTLACLARPFVPRGRGGRRVLFVTANLNAGGAQRSLLNLALALKGRIDFEIAVTGNSSSNVFSSQLAAAGIACFRSGATRDCFDHAEALIAHVVASAPSSVCFWNLDAKVKLLLSKWLGHSSVKIIDVSPGDYLFEEMGATAEFQHCIAWSEQEYFARIDTLVHKYCAAPHPLAGRKARVIPNGVTLPHAGRAVSLHECSARVLVCGRIAPTKFLLEAIEAMRLLWKRLPQAELHVLGGAEHRHRDYSSQVDAAAASAQSGRGGQIVFHGAVSDAPEQMARYDVVLVLGHHQGCPNTVLEALAAGVPVVANDSGGTRELILHGKTGLLLQGIEPEAIAAALLRILDDAALAKRLAAQGRSHVKRKFSMQKMCNAYLKLFL